jgi:hypothetical protein
MRNNDVDGLDWLREIRTHIAAECENNVHVLGEYYREIQQEYATSMKTYSALPDIQEAAETKIPDNVAQSAPEPALM